MRIQKGKPHFAKREIWNLDLTLAPIIHQALSQYKSSNRHGYPMEAIYDYFIDVEKMSREDVKERLNKDPNDFDSDIVSAYFETILDTMIFAFSKEAKLDYEDIVEQPYNINFLREQDAGTTKYSQVTLVPRANKTSEDISKYKEDRSKYYEELKVKVEKGLNYFSTYFYSLWD